METFRRTLFIFPPGNLQKFNNFWQLRERNSPHDNNLEGRVKRNDGPFQPRGKFRLFLPPEDKKLPRIIQESFLAKARTRKNFYRSLKLFSLGVLRVEWFALPLRLWSSYNGPGGTDVRAGPAVGAEGRVNARMLFPGGDGVQGAYRQTFSAVGAFFGDLVRHKKNSSPLSAFSGQLRT
jgi:hypothetical protein